MYELINQSTMNIQAKVEHESDKKTKKEKKKSKSKSKDDRPRSATKQPVTAGVNNSLYTSADETCNIQDILSKIKPQDSEMTDANAQNQSGAKPNQEDQEMS
jgi:hypothetical protein